MNLQRTIALGAACGAVAVWLAASPASNIPQSAPETTRATTPIEARGADLANEVARLRERLRPTTAPLQTRDLFRYRQRSSAASSRLDALTSAVPAQHEADPAAVSKPRFALVGLAEDDGPDGPVRTAIISGAGGLFLVKEGDAVTARYRVGAISPDVVELTDVSDGTPLRLALK